MRVSDLKQMEVINICNGKRIGFVGDLIFDKCSGMIESLIVPGPGCICGFLGREKEFVIPYCDICQIGDDIILVKIEEKDHDKNKKPHC